MKNNINNVLKYIWLGIAIACFSIFVYLFTQYGWKKAQSFALLTPIALLFFWVRRKKSLSKS